LRVVVDLTFKLYSDCDNYVEKVDFSKTFRDAIERRGTLSDNENQLCFRDQNLCSFMKKDIKIEKQKEMIELMTSSYFPNGSVDAFNSINLLNTFTTKIKIPNKNEVIGFCVEYTKEETEQEQKGAKALVRYP